MMTMDDPLLQRDRADLRMAARSLLLDLLPAAVQVGAIPAVRGSTGLLKLAREDWASPTAIDDLDEAGTRAHDRARLILGRVALELEAAVADAVAGGDQWRANALPLRLQAERLAGYIDGFYRAGADRTVRAAEGRSDTGRRTEERVKTAVKRYRERGLTRSAAAARAAPDVGLTPESLRKMLSKLFPGESWDLKRNAQKLGK